MRLFINPGLLERLQEAQRKISEEDAADKAASFKGAAGEEAAEGVAAYAALAAEGGSPLDELPAALSSAIKGSAGDEAATASKPGAVFQVGAPLLLGSRECLTKSHIPDAFQDGQMYVSVSDIAAGKELGPVEAAQRRTKLALEMLQEYYMRSNPTATMTLATEGFIILVSCLVSATCCCMLLLLLLFNNISCSCMM